MKPKKNLLILLLLTTLFFVYNFFIYTDNSSYGNIHLSEKAIRGENLWLKNNCNSCHQIYGLGGYLGPDLTNEYAKRSEAFIIAFIKNGNNTMPQFDLTDQELHSLMQFLKLLDSSGSSDPRTFKINTNGSIEQE